jgi:CRP-like cAMP-binding protein
VIELRTCAAFSRASDADIARIQAVSREWLVEGDTVLYRQGEPAAAFYVLLAGEVRFTSTDGTAVASPGECFGELDVLDDSKRGATATAVGGSRLIVIPRTEFEVILLRSPTLARSILESIESR